MNESTPRAGTLHLLPHQGVWGTGRFVIEFVRHERMDGVPDEIVLTERPLDVDGDFMAPATPVHALGLDGESARVRGRRIADIAEGRGLGALVAYTTEDLLLAAEARRHAPTLRLATLLFEPPPRGLGWLGRRRFRAALAAVSPLHCASPAVTEAWRTLDPRAETRMAAVDVQRYSPGEATSPWRAARVPDGRTLVVGSLMRAEPAKRQDVLIEAVRRRNEAGRPTALVLVGDGPLSDDLQARARATHDLYAVRRVLDSPGFLRSMDAIALHAEGETVPMALLEALAVGRPAVVADAGPVAELVGADVALFTDVGDVDATLAALDRLGDPEERATIGAAARTRAVERHNLAKLRATLAGERLAPA